MQRGQRYNNYSGYDNRWDNQTTQQVPAWQQNNGHQQLSDMELELEMMKRKRQVLQEQRQLLEEQQRLERLQVKRNNIGNNTWNEPVKRNNMGNNTWNEPMKRNNMGNTTWNEPRRFTNNRSGQYFNDEPSYMAPYVADTARRGRKRPATGWAPSNTKRHAPAPSLERQVERDVGPVDSPPVFRGVEQATPTMRGKIEFALGRIVREMRESHGFVLMPSQLKDLKERVRQRLHKMMMNKPVTTPEAVHDLYRLSHTTRGDLRLLETVRAASAVAAVAPASAPSAPASAPQPKKTPRAPPRAERQVRERSEGERPEQSPEKAAILRNVKMYIHKMLEDKLDGVFNKLHKICLEEAGITEPVKSENVKSETKEESSNEPNSDGAVEETKIDGTGSVEDKPVDTAAVEPESGETGVVEDKSDKTGEPKLESTVGQGSVPKDSEENKDNNMDEDEKVQYIQAVMARILQQKIPAMLLRYKRHMVSILARDETFRKLGLDAPIEIPDLPKAQIFKQLFYVKIVGRPSLPQRNTMQSFLDGFDCVSVKKHKSIYNLLFVGVTTEESYQKLLDSDGIEIGGRRLEIRRSDRQRRGDKKDKEPEANGVDAATSDVIGTSDDKTIDDTMTAMDSEITDLLTSINNTEEDKDVSTMDAEITDILTSIDNTEEDKDASVVLDEKPAEVILVEDDSPASGVGASVAENASQESEGNVAQQSVEKPEVEAAAGIRTRRSSRLPQKN